MLLYSPALSASLSQVQEVVCCQSCCPSAHFLCYTKGVYLLHFRVSPSPWEHTVAEFPEMCCPGLSAILIVVPSFPVFSLVRPLLYLHSVYARFHGSCNMQRIQAVTSGWAHTHRKCTLLSFSVISCYWPFSLFPSPSHFRFMADNS